MGDLPHSYEEIGELTETAVIILGTTFQALNHWARERLLIILTTEDYSFRLGDLVWVKEWNFQPLKPLWRGPFPIILSTPTAVKVAKIMPWIHHRRLKPVATNWECISDSTKPLRPTLRKKTLTGLEDRRKSAPLRSYQKLTNPRAAEASGW
uniref:Murine leukemia virus integrase C-terminal domain-containing protein n=1 Tax=Rousettus aegyptiacus TaxID=9407 RepID=A0A7J8H1Q4_ROUAE|nr:hypothetical protein HJG63_011259 [Rousettus aegyptiacus]